MKNDTWIQTATGRKVYPMFMRPGDVSIDDIAHSLSNMCRFTGHVREFYSVSQHSVWVSHYCAPKDALWGLLHDASEAYLVDIPRPLKRAPEFSFYRELERDVQGKICEAFGLSLVQPASVYEADHRMLATEARDLMSPLHPDWRVMDEPYARRIIGWDPASAKAAFLRRFNALMEARDPEGIRPANEQDWSDFAAGRSE